jgi:hypothetical protein
MTLYMNGRLASARTDAVPQAVPATSVPFRIGCTGDSTPTAPAEAVVDDVRLFDRVLSAGEIGALAQ